MQFPFVPADVEAPIIVVLHFRTVPPRNDVDLLSSCNQNLPLSCY
jgi:hypothetical protein